MAFAKAAAALLCLALTASLIAFGLVRLTSLEPLSSLFGAVTSARGLPGTPEEQLELEAELAGRCETEGRAEIALDNLTLRFDCARLRAGATLEELFGSAFFEALYYRSWGCTFWGCVRGWLAGLSGPEFLISELANSAYRKFSLGLAALAGLFALVLAASSRAREWPRNFGLCFFIVGLGWIGLEVARRIGDRFFEAELGLSGLLTSALRPLSAVLLGLLLFGAALLLLGHWLRKRAQALEQRLALPP